MLRDGEGSMMPGFVNGPKFAQRSGMVRRHGIRSAGVFVGALAIVAAICVNVANVSAAYASASAPDHAAARALFDQARKLMDARKFVEAMPKLEASQGLDPASGTLILLGHCYEELGRTASAWAAFNDAAAMARITGKSDHVKHAEKQVKLLEPRLSKLLIDVAPENQSVEIRRDGKAVDPGLWGVAVPVDPGSHTIEAMKTGKQGFTGTIAIAPNPGVTTAHVPVLADLPPPPPPLPPPFWNARRKAGAAVGATGIGGLAVGAVFGGLTFSKKAESNSAPPGSRPHCTTSAGKTVCDPTGLAIRSTATTYANVANVALAVGASAAVAGVVLFATASPGDEAKPSSALQVRAGAVVGATSAGFWMKGAW